MQERATPQSSEPLIPPSAEPSARVLPLPFFLLRFIRNPLCALPRDVYEKDIVTYGAKRPLVVWITRPDYIERVLLSEAQHFPKTRLDKRILNPVVGSGLLTTEGEAWRWQRRIASPLFRQSEILKYVPVMASAATERIARWSAMGPVLEPDIGTEMTELTFAVIARTVLAGIKEQDADSIKAAGHAYLDKITWEIAAALLRVPNWVWHPAKGRMRRAASAIRAEVHHLLEERRGKGVEGDDLVARLLSAVDPETGDVMTDAQLVDNLATFLLAGHETTAKALTWAIYLLARAPEWQERCRAEVEGAIGTGPLEARHLGELATTTRVLKEAMRLFPPVPVLTRVSTREATFGDVALTAPTLVVIPVYAVHRHHVLWPEPGRFDPDRFLPEREIAMARTQYMPFGFGPRFCIGSAFAMTEALTILAILLKRTAFSWDGKAEPEPVSRVTLRPRGRLGVKIAHLQ